MFIGIEAQTCNNFVNGESVWTTSVGYSIGLQVSAGFGKSGYISNARTVDELLGWNACLTGSFAGSAQVCVSIGFNTATGETVVPTDNIVWTISGGLGKGVGGGFSKGIVYTDRVVKANE